MSEINKKTENREFQEKLSQMSPFEIKGTLISLAVKYMTKI